jgi:hypothetical protein
MTTATTTDEFGPLGTLSRPQDELSNKLTDEVSSDIHDVELSTQVQAWFGHHEKPVQKGLSAGGDTSRKVARRDSGSGPQPGAPL